MYAQLAEDGHIVAVGEEIEGGVEFEPPDDFEIGLMFEWSIIDGVCERIPVEPIERVDTVTALIEGLATATTLSQIRSRAKALLDATDLVEGVATMAQDPA